MMAGTKMSTFMPGENTEPKSKLAGRTPTTLTASPLTVMAWPMIAGFEPYCRRQKPWLSKAAGLPPFWHSSGRKSRPSEGWTPSIGKRLQATSMPTSCLGSPLPVNLYWMEL